MHPKEIHLLHSELKGERKPKSGEGRRRVGAWDRAGSVGVPTQPTGLEVRDRGASYQFHAVTPAIFSVCLVYVSSCPKDLKMLLLILEIILKRR